MTLQDNTTDGMDTMLVAAGVNELARHVNKCAVDHGWWPNIGRNMGEMLMLMVSELSEGLESWRDDEPVLWYDYGHNHGKPSGGELDELPWAPTEAVTVGDCNPEDITLGKPCGLASELADTIIRILDTAHHMNIPVTEALVRKHQYNLTRPYRHGGKRA